MSLPVMLDLLSAAVSLLAAAVIIAVTGISAKKNRLSRRTWLYQACTRVTYVYAAELSYLTFWGRGVMASRKINLTPLYPKISQMVEHLYLHERLPFADAVHTAVMRYYNDIELLVLNMIVLIPGGILLGYILQHQKRSFKQFLLFGFLAIFGIELLQHITLLGFFDIDDILCNMLGYTLGGLLGRHIEKRLV